MMTAAIANSGIAVQQNLTRQAIATEVLRASANADQQVANILSEAVEAGAQATRGQNVNIVV